LRNILKLYQYKRLHQGPVSDSRGPFFVQIGSHKKVTQTAAKQLPVLRYDSCTRADSAAITTQEETGMTPTSTILTEEIMTLKDARGEIAAITGKRPDLATLSRWIHRGVGGTRLEAVRVGRQLLTSKQALTRFIEARTATSIG
jgi:hypothetical protein